MLGFTCQAVRVFSLICSLFRARLCWGGGGSVANEGLVLYIGGDCGLHLECYVTCTMLWAYVMSDMFARGVMCDVRDAHLESGPLIGAPPSGASRRIESQSG